MTFDEAILLDIDRLTAIFLTFRTAIQDKQKAFDESQKPFKEQMEIIRNALHKKLIDMGATSVKTPEGTPYISTVSAVKVEDWDAFYTFVEEVQDPDLLVKNANKTKVEEYIETTGKPVPGVKITQIQTLNVRS